MGSPGGSIRVARNDQMVWVRVTGRATFRESLGLEAYLESCVQECPPSDVQVDLSQCVFMDSTFIGTLVKLATGHVISPDATCRTTSPSPECQALIASMHLEQVLTIVGETPPPPAKPRELPVVTFDPRSLGYHALEAHEHLAEADADNARIFGPVVRQLRKELNEKDDADGGGENTVSKT